MKVHLVDILSSLEFPSDNKDRFNIAICGYVRKLVTYNSNNVTCKMCLKEIERRK